MNVCQSLSGIPGTDLLCWWYSWGFFLFLVLDLVAIFWIIYDSVTRGRKAIGWILAAIVPPLFVLPSLFLFFASTEAVQTIVSRNLIEPFFYLGLLGGVVPIIVLVAYLLSASRQPAPTPSPMPGPSAYDPTKRQPSSQPRPRSSSAGATQRQSSGAQVRPAVPKANALLYVQTGPASGRQFQLNTGRTKVGRDQSKVDIVIDDPEVSAEHFQIAEQDGHYRIYDLGALNGTFLNGNRIDGPQYLHDSDEIKAGASAIRFKSLDG